MHLSNVKLYEGLLDNYREQLQFSPSEHAKFVFKNEYAYNDSRMEGVDVTQEQAAEIVTDLRLNKQNSVYCIEKNEPFISIAGHQLMYDGIFAIPVKDSISVFDMLVLNKKLFQYYPHPEFGGNIRKNNTLVLGAKFETADYNDIFRLLGELDTEVKQYYQNRANMPVSTYIEHVIRIHHRITKIHPFGDGNGRTSRAFMNLQLVVAGFTPLYIGVEHKDEYVDALARADKYGEYDDLYEVIFKAICHSHVILGPKAI